MSLSLVERKNIIYDATHQAIKLKITIIPGIWKIFKEYIEKGINQVHDIYMQDIDKLMIIRLYNQKSKKSYICLRQK